MLRGNANAQKDNPESVNFQSALSTLTARQPWIKSAAATPSRSQARSLKHFECVTGTTELVTKYRILRRRIRSESGTTPSYLNPDTSRKNFLLLHESLLLSLIQAFTDFHRLRYLCFCCSAHPNQRSENLFALSIQHDPRSRAEATYII